MKCVVNICHATNCKFNRFKHERLKECMLDEVNVSTDGSCKQFTTDRLKGFRI